MDCVGLSEQAQGSLDYDDIAAAFRSCFKASGSKARKPIGALMVDPDDEGAGLQSASLIAVIAGEEDSFADVEAFLADFSGEKLSEELSEGEAAEALAVAWKDRRKEIQQVQQSTKIRVICIKCSVTKDVPCGD